MTPAGWLTSQEATLLASRAKGRCLEVGTWQGLSASVLAPLVDILWCVDPHENFDGIGESWPQFLKWLAETDAKNVVPVRATLKDAWCDGLIPDGEYPPYDYIYIDGDHRYASVKDDLDWAQYRTRTIACHDYGCGAYGVTQAVDEFCAKTGWKLAERAGSLTILEKP